MRTKIFASLSNSVRISHWILVQNDDGTLHVEQEAEYLDGEWRSRKVPINDFMCEGGPAPHLLQKLVDRMFAD